MVSPRSISIWNPSKVFLIFYVARNLRERILLCGNFYDRFHWHSFIMSYLFNVWMGYSFVKFFVFTNVTQMKMFAFFFPIILLLIFLYIIYFTFFLSFFQPWWCSINNQREIGTEIFRSTGKQNINPALFNIDKLSVKYYNDYQWTGMSLRACCRLILLAKKDLSTSSNCSRRQRHGVILKEQLSKKSCLN